MSRDDDTTRDNKPVTEGGCGCDGRRCCASGAPDGRRRAILGGLTAWLFAPLLPFARTARAATKDPKKMRVQPGDQLVYKLGDRKDEVVTVADVEEGARPIVAYPYDPVNDVIRKGSRLNQILVLRLAEGGYSEETRAYAYEGVIAYTATCSHQNCPVTGWDPETELFICPCHETHYDPKDGARVVSGPAKRPLPALPLTAEDGILVAAESLTGKVGRR